MPMKSSKERQYPPQTGFYKIKVKEGAAWRFFDACRLQISVGQEKHEGKKFDATIDWASQRFQKIVVCVNDTLQRFGLMADFGLSESEAREQALQAGNRWIGQVLALHLDKNPEIIRWDHWLRHPDYSLMRKKMDDLYGKNRVFRDAVESEIDVFMKRREQEGRVVGKVHRDLSRQYLLEEISVLPLMFNQQRAADVYPGTSLLPLRLAQEGKIEGYCQTADVVFTRIGFARNEGKEKAA